LSYANIDINNCANINSLVIKDIPDTKTFATFTKIAMNGFTGLAKNDVHRAHKIYLPDLGYEYNVRVVFCMEPKNYSGGDQNAVRIYN
jgi:hypothetical protein